MRAEQAATGPDAATADGSTVPRVVLVEDIAALRLALPMLLHGLDLVGVFADAESLLEEAPDADVALLDLRLANAAQPGAVQGLSMVERVVGAGYRVCLYSQEERPFVLAACVAGGARGLVAKTDPPELVVEAVRRIHEGEVVLPSTLLGLAEVLERRGNLRLLTPRQRELLAGRARGRTYAEIATDLHLSESTLRGYWADISAVVADHLRSSSAADLEQAMGLAPGDLLWPSDQAAPSVPRRRGPSLLALGADRNRRVRRPGPRPT